MDLRVGGGIEHLTVLITERLTTFLVKYLEILAFRLLDHKGSWWLNLFSALIDYVLAMQLQSHGSVLPNPFLDLSGRIFVFHKKHV